MSETNETDQTTSRGDRPPVAQPIRNVRRYADQDAGQLPGEHPFGVDTVHVRLPGMDCWALNTKRHGLTVYPPPVYSPLQRAEREAEGKDAQPEAAPLFRDGHQLVEGGRAQARTEHVHVTVKPGGVAMLQLSLPKMIRPDNRVPVWTEDEMDQAMQGLAIELASLGIVADLQTGILSRLDLARDVATLYPEHAYVPMLQKRLRLSRQRPQGMYPTSYHVGNKSRRTRFYGKLEEMANNGHDVTGYPPQLRVEHQLNNLETIRGTVGISTLPDLLTCPTSAVEGYQTQMLNLFKTEPTAEPVELAELEADNAPSVLLTLDKLLHVFRTTAEKSPRAWRAHGLSAIALAVAEKQGAIPTLYDAIRQVAAERSTGSDPQAAGRNAASRARGHRDDLAEPVATLDLELGQMEAMYAELRGVLLSAV